MKLKNSYLTSYLVKTNNIKPLETQCGDLKVILKDKKLQKVKAPNAIAGQKQENEIAFFLRREFKNHPQVFIINDYKFTFNDEKAQIDHLIIYPYGFLIVESKSIYGEVKVNELGEWSRSYKSEWSGMPSPIKQAELQQTLLQQYLHQNRGDILGKLLGFRQQSFGKRSWNILCTVSSSSIIERTIIPKNISDVVVKNEFLIDKINKTMDLQSNLMKIINIIDIRPEFSEEELTAITNFLINIKNEKQNKEVENSLDKSLIVECKKCKETTDVTTRHGKYGYFINCNKCKTNTAIKRNCPQCQSNNTKVAKKKETYTLNCLDCCNKSLLILGSVP